ncbi:hypothetical protein [Rhabdothermincola salaria]|uniref:hypothetical protein n=1 Tax=Rhabdothermincola salaria TaxID=2903142 RepID=UPI001E4ABE44|nr:hypothetical protein [Rhabdothermincola salaria]MCD9623613.1 hypothetical protein [Rhabdothermincola salaria]
MSTSHDHRSAPAGTDADLPGERLVEIALALAAREADGPATYVEVLDILDLGGTDPVAEHALPPSDPVAGLLGRCAASSAWAVGLTGAGRVRAIDDTTTLGHGRFVHLVSRHGVSVTVVPPTAANEGAIVLGPTTTTQSGRVPDACRRIVGLPTAPPPRDTAAALVDHWLDAVLSTSLLAGSLSWADVLRCHPLARLLDGLELDPDLVAAAAKRFRWLRRATDDDVARDLFDAVDGGEPDEGAGRSVTLADLVVHHMVGRDTAAAFAEQRTDLGGWSPAQIADLTGAAGRVVTWEVLRLAAICRADPAALLDACTLSWMDAGMFARWTLGDALPTAVALDVLGRSLPGSVHDRLTAALSLLSTHDGEPLPHR